MGRSIWPAMPFNLRFETKKKTVFIWWIILLKILRKNEFYRKSSFPAIFNEDISQKSTIFGRIQKVEISTIGKYPRLTASPDSENSSYGTWASKTRVYGIWISP
jgi:hypothetical protein